MRSIRARLHPFLVRVIHALLPRPLRRYIIKVMLKAEEASPPQEAARWLLGVYDDVGLEIDAASHRWGNGVHIKHEVMDGIHSFFYERIPPGSHVLDLGCGIGAVANAIAAHSDADVLGIDLSRESIAFAREHYQHPHLKFIQGDVFKDIPDVQAIDVIVLSSVLEHLQNRAGFLRSLAERFHPKKFLIRVPTFEQHYFKALKRELGMFAYVDPTHVLEYSPEIFEAEMAEAGLDIKHLEIRWGDIWAECTPQVDGGARTSK